MIPEAVDDVKHHSQQDDTHADGDSHDKYRVQLADKRQICHVFHGTQPYGVDNRFEAEYASEHKTEDGGEESAAGDDGRQIRLLEPVKQKAAEQEAESLSHVSEHEAEEEGVGDADQHGRIDLIIGRKAVHLDKHFKRLKQLRVMKLCRRSAYDVVMVILHDAEGLFVVRYLLLERLGVLFTHPAAQNIEGIDVLLRAGRQLPDIKVCGEGGKLLIGGQKLIALAAQHLGHLTVYRVDIRLKRGDLVLQGVNGV